MVNQLSNSVATHGKTHTTIKKTPLLNSVQHYVVRLAANDGMEENTLDTPTAIHPVEQLLSPENGSISLDVPSYSLNIVRIK